jgi:hypothetical protein
MARPLDGVNFDANRGFGAARPGFTFWTIYHLRLDAS